MENKPKKHLYMDIVGGPKKPAAPVRQPAKTFPKSTPTASSRDPFRPRPVIDSAVLERRAAERSRPLTDFRRPAGAASRPATSQSIPRPARPVSQPKVITATTVKTVAATPEKVETFEFGIIEDLTPDTPSALQSVDHSADGRRTPAMEPHSAPQPASRPAATSQSNSSSDYLRATPAAEPEDKKRPAFFKKPHSAPAEPPKSPFLTVNVPKRPLSASAPTGLRAAPLPRPEPTKKPERPARKRRKNAPFIVIVILSILLGVALGALVYFVLPH